MLSYALISSSKVSRVRTGIACALAAAPWLVLRGLRAVAFVAAAVLAFVVRSSRSRLFTVDRDGSASFRGRRSGTLRARSCESCTRQRGTFTELEHCWEITNVHLALTFDHSLS